MKHKCNLTLISSVASPICQDGQSERTFLIFAFSSRFSSFFPDFPLFFPIFDNFFAVRGGTLLPPVAMSLTLITSPLLESGMQTFGSWIQKNLDWHQVLEASGTKNIADAFYTILDLDIKHMFSRKKEKGSLQ